MTKCTPRHLQVRKLKQRSGDSTKRQKKNGENDGIR